MKPITITIKPKLKWDGGDAVYECVVGEDKFIIWHLINYELTHNSKSIGTFKSLEIAKVVAELIYQG